MRFLATFLIAGWLGGLFSHSADAAVKTWRTYDGKSVKAEAVHFDFETKTLTLEDPDSGERTAHFSQDLDFGSKRQLLLSNIFHTSFPDTGFWPPKEKIVLFGIGIFSPIALLVTGMWLSGVFIVRNFNPFSALSAFLGSWLAGVILVACYLVFAARSQTGNTFVWAGALIAAVVMTLFTSSVYKTKFLTGLLIFVCHIVFAAILAGLLIYGVETLRPADEVHAFWEKWVFRPTGLVHNGEGY